jgi:hypothetical protein
MIQSVGFRNLRNRHNRSKRVGHGSQRVDTGARGLATGARDTT